MVLIKVPHCHLYTLKGIHIGGLKMRHIALKLVSLCALVLVCSCETPPLATKIPNWIKTTTSDSSEPLDQEESLDVLVLEEDKKLPSERVLLVGNNLKWSAVVRDICEQCDLSVLIPQEYHDVYVDVSFNNVLLESALVELCSAVGNVSFTLDDNLIVFDSSIVQSVGRIESKYADVKNLEQVVSSILDDNANVAVSGNTIVVGGSETMVQQSKLIADLIGSNQPDLWQVEICILSMSTGWQMDLGVKGSIGGIFKLDSDSDSVLDMVLDGYWSVDMGYGIDDILLRSSLVLLEGSSAVVKSIEEIPVPRRTVSPQGTVSISGYDTVESGITLALRGVAVPSGMRVEISPDVSDIIRFEGDKPLISRKTVTTSVIIESGDVILLSGLWGDRFSDKGSLPLDLEKSNLTTEWLVCARFKEF